MAIPSPIQAPEQGAFDSLGLRLVYHVWGPAEGRPLLFLHGFLDQGRAFGPTARRLAAEGWRVIALDQRGHGLSGHVWGGGGYYHFPDYILDVDGLYRALGWEEAAVVAHSMGGSVALYFAGSFPERVTQLVLLDNLGPPASAEPAPDRMRRWIADIRLVEGRPPARGVAELDLVVERLSKASPHADPDTLREIAATAVGRDEDGQWRFLYDRLHRTRAPITFDAERFEGFLRSIKAPVLGIWGEHSRLRFASVEARAQHLADYRSEVLDETGHNLHHEAPDRVADAILAFLAVT